MLKNLMTALCAILFSAIAAKADAVVILQYHHVSDNTPKSTSVTPSQFAEQMQYLADNDFSVIPLTQAVAQIKNQQVSKPKQVVITFDDGYDSIINNAAPILAQHQFPYTVFISVEPIEQAFKGMMSWQQINQLVEQGALMANHSWAHEHLIRRLPDETDGQWRERIKQNLLNTEAKIVEKTGQSAKMLAYPYGEFDQQLADLVTELGFVGFGQQSGAAGPYSMLTGLPRFPVAHDYADMASLKTKFNSLNMPITHMNITDPLLPQGKWRPELKVTIETDDINPAQVMCFIQGQGSQTPRWLDKNTFVVQAEQDLPAGRSRYNCTAPSIKQGGYYWFSQAWVRPKDDGSWVKE
ncbi:polysaccharide deacetylase family protein [Shewanella gaetbuli]